MSLFCLHFSHFFVHIPSLQCQHPKCFLCPFLCNGTVHYAPKLYSMPTILYSVPITYTHPVLYSMTTPHVSSRKFLFRDRRLSTPAVRINLPPEPDSEQLSLNFKDKVGRFSGTSENAAINRAGEVSVYTAEGIKLSIGKTSSQNGGQCVHTVHQSVRGSKLLLTLTQTTFF
jgi:hypothetical protein